MNEISKLLNSMESLLAAGSYLAGGMIPEIVPTIPDEEWQQVATASPKRQREFSCGRNYSHQLLDQLGFSNFIIGRDDKGCPLWPDGLAGSISHTNNYCVAMIAPTDSYVSLGVDLEESGRMKKTLWPRLFTAAEIQQLGNIGELDKQLRQAAVIFSAKEAFYKCDYPINRQLHEFTDIEITLNSTSRTLQVNQLSQGELAGYQGHYVTGMTHVMTVIQKTA